MHKDLVTIVTVESKKKAEIFQVILENHGISVFVAPNEKIIIMGETSISKQPFDVMVERGAVEEALDTLRSRQTQEIPATATELDITAVTCRHCGERILAVKSAADSVQKCPKCSEILSNPSEGP